MWVARRSKLARARSSRMVVRIGGPGRGGGRPEQAVPGGQTPIRRRASRQLSGRPPGPAAPLRASQRPARQRAPERGARRDGSLRDDGRAALGHGGPRHRRDPGQRHGVRARRHVRWRQSPQGAPLALSGNPATPWRTDWYATATFGNLKAGAGLLLDLARTLTITGAAIQPGNIPGAGFQLHAGTTPADLATVASDSAAGGLVRLRLRSPVRARYLLIWFTLAQLDEVAGTRRPG
jgi:hypothetical protein